ncbi:DUF1294 domain-containing protein [Agromyces sp. SYSU T00266]|uniref:DUF1294 domain-containing protein n=1 Tax=Agromyces zhanjiangensis TaxID=3158562 RepID=UPI00339253CF
MRPEPTAARRGPHAASRPPRPAARPERDLSRPLPAALSWGVLVAFAAALAVGLLVGAVPWWLAVWFGAASLVDVAAYGADKAAARRGAPRVAERTLHLVDLAGGWPGALVAQQAFRHKTRKRSFRRVFWATVVANLLLALGLVALLGSPELALGGIRELVGR